MSLSFNRKHFFKNFIGSGGLFYSLQLQGQKPRKPPALQPDLVKQFVGKAQSGIEALKDLVAKKPGLINASWDWGGGDFKSPLKLAKHVGDKKIAAFLLANGAGMNIFLCCHAG